MKRTLLIIAAFFVLIVAPHVVAAGFSGGSALSEYQHSGFEHQDFSVEDHITEE